MDSDCSREIKRRLLLGRKVMTNLDSILKRKDITFPTRRSSDLNVRSMNQGKLEVVKQEMARVNVDILAISELKWTGMGEFNSDDLFIYYCGYESFRRNGVALKNKVCHCFHCFATYFP